MRITKSLFILGLTAGAGVLPAQAQVDWVGIHADSIHLQTKIGNYGTTENKKNNRTRRTTKKPVGKSAKSAPKVIERYPRVRVNGHSLSLSSPAIQRNGRTFIPFRDIFEALGAEVNYDQQARTITATRGRSVVQLRSSGATTGVEGKQATFSNDEKPFIRNGVTMVPLRMVAEEMGAQVRYVSSGKTPLIEINGRM